MAGVRAKSSSGIFPIGALGRLSLSQKDERSSNEVSLTEKCSLNETISPEIHISFPTKTSNNASPKMNISQIFFRFMTIVTK